MGKGPVRKGMVSFQNKEGTNLSRSLILLWSLSLGFPIAWETGAETIYFEPAVEGVYIAVGDGPESVAITPDARY